MCEKNIDIIFSKCNYPIEMLSYGIITKKNWQFLSNEDKTKILKSYGLNEKDYEERIKNIIETEIVLINKLLRRIKCNILECKFIIKIINWD